MSKLLMERAVEQRRSVFVCVSEGGLGGIGVRGRGGERGENQKEARGENYKKAFNSSLRSTLPSHRHEGLIHRRFHTLLINFSGPMFTASHTAERAPHFIRRGRLSPRSIALQTFLILL